jgi:hypothetical protein
MDSEATRRERAIREHERFAPGRSPKRADEPLVSRAYANPPAPAGDLDVVLQESRSTVDEELDARTSPIPRDHREDVPLGPRLRAEMDDVPPGGVVRSSREGRASGGQEDQNAHRKAKSHVGSHRLAVGLP